MADVEQWAPNALDTEREYATLTRNRYKWMRKYMAVSGTLYDGGELAIRITMMDGPNTPLRTELLGWVKQDCDHRHCQLESIVGAAGHHLVQLMQEYLEEASAPLAGHDGEVSS